MASKKLKVEVELETAKAKRQAKELEQSRTDTRSEVGSRVPRDRVGFGTRTPDLTKKFGPQPTQTGETKKQPPDTTSEVPRAASKLAESMSSAARSAADFAAKAKREPPQTKREPEKPVANVATTVPKSADKLAESMDRASKSVGELGDKSKASSSQLAGVVRSFAGLGMGMAISYAARNMERGTARTAVEATGGAVQGASMASAALMAIPGGALVKGLLTAAGGALGAGKVLLDKKGEQDAFSTDFVRSEKEYEQSREWAGKFKDITGAGKTDMKLPELEDTVGRIAAAIKDLNAEEKSRIATIKEEIAAGKLDAAQREQSELATTRGKIAQLESVRDNYNARIEAEKNRKPEPEFRESLSGTDSLQKIGLAGGETGSAVPPVRPNFSGENNPPVQPTQPVQPNFDGVDRMIERAAAKFSERISGGRDGRSYDFTQVSRTGQTLKMVDEAAERLNRQSLEVLKSIDEHIRTKEGTISWQ